MFDKKTLERFERFVYPDPNSGCFIWAGATSSKGYGDFFVSKPVVKHYQAHRFAWLASGLKIPDGMIIRHRCDVRCCVNVDHLLIGTVSDNALDMAARCRGTKGLLPYGVALGGKYGKPYRATIQIGPAKHFGSFDTIEEAAAAALAGKREILLSLGRKASEIML